MAGLPQGFKVELFLGGSWVDVTSWHAGEQPTTLHAGRPNEFGNVGPGTWSFALRNEGGEWTPRSTASPYYPYVVPGVQVRMSVTQGGVSRWLANGKVVSWVPSWPGNGVVGGIVTMSCADALRDLEGVTLDDRWTEEARVVARTGGTWCDIPRLAGDGSTTGFDNLGLIGGASSALGVASLEAAADGAGSASYSTPSGLILSRCVALAPSADVGPLVRLDVQGAPGTADFWLSVPDSRTSVTQAVMVAYDGGGSPVGSLWLEPDGAGGLNLVARVGVGAGSDVVLVTGVHDAAWRRISLVPAGSPTSTVISVDGASTASVTQAWDMRTAVTFRWGGTTGNGSSAALSLAGVVVTGGGTPLVTAHGQQGQAATATAMFATLASFVPSVTAWATTGIEDRTIGEPTWPGQTAAAVLQQLARTVNGIGWARPDGAVELIMGDVARPVSPVAVLDVAADLDPGSTPPTFEDSAATQPTRVTITYAGGTVTSVNTAAEAAGRPQVPVTIDTCAADQTAALFAGSYVLQATDALRMSRVAVDLLHSVSDLWAVMLQLFPSQLLRTANWPVVMTGAANVDIHAEGWDVEFAEDHWRYVFDCSPAGLVPMGVWDGGDEYGRWAFEGATVTGGTAVGTTAPGTLVVAFTGGVGLSTDAGDYPLYLDWNGEAVRVDAPPGGTSSPQTVTTATRGDLLTAARVHSAGDVVDVYHSASWGF